MTPRVHAIALMAGILAAGASPNLDAKETACSGDPMSRDIFVQDLPPGLKSIDDLPDDFKPDRSLVKRSAVLAAIRAEAPDAKEQPDGWLVIERSGHYYIEVNLDAGEDQPDGFAFHVSGSCEADVLIGRILKRLGLQALDGDSPDGLFHPPE